MLNQGTTRYGTTEQGTRTRRRAALPLLPG